MILLQANIIYWESSSKSMPNATWLTLWGQRECQSSTKAGEIPLWALTPNKRPVKSLEWSKPLSRGKTFCYSHKMCPPVNSSQGHAGQWLTVELTVNQGTPNLDLNSSFSFHCSHYLASTCSLFAFILKGNENHRFCTCHYLNNMILIYIHIQNYYTLKLQWQSLCSQQACCQKH